MHQSKHPSMLKLIMMPMQVIEEHVQVGSLQQPTQERTVSSVQTYATPRSVQYLEYQWPMEQQYLSSAGQCTGQYVFPESQAYYPAYSSAGSFVISSYQPASYGSSSYVDQSPLSTYASQAGELVYSSADGGAYISPRTTGAYVPGPGQ
jgi:hypothetical protein